jgi:hypothetical protein
MAGPLLFLLACGSAMEEVPDSDLQQQAHDCQRTADKSPAMTVQCDKVAEECALRRDAGRFVC